MRAVIRDYRVLFLTALSAAVVLLAGGTAEAAPGPHTLTIYSVATGAQYLNNGDDRGRGVHDNPFDARTSKLRPKVSDAGSGPFPGDVAVFTLSLYAKPDLKKNIGSAAYTCYYNYAKRALCMAYYEMNGDAAGRCSRRVS